MSENAGQIVRRAEYPGVRVSERLHAHQPELQRHSHESLQICLVLEGELLEEFDGVRLDCGPGTVLLRPPLAMHRDTFRSAAVRTLLVEYFPVPRFDPLFGGAAGFSPPESDGGLKSAAPQALAAAAREIRRELCSMDLASSAALEGRLLQLAAQLIRAASEPHRAWFARARRRIDEALPHRVDVHALAAELDVSRSHLLETFRRMEGKTIGAYVAQRRLEHARQLLAETTAPLSDIACACGFADQSHFTRVFRSASGETPTQFRRRIRI